MQKIESLSEIRSVAAQHRSAGRTMALVPTSGALHAGHAALIALAKSQADVVVVATFVNPLAFGPGENFAGYPRSPDADAKLCEELNVDVLFCPKTEEFFPEGHSTFVVEEAVSVPLCGVSRPTHFRGAITAVAKMLNLIRPDLLVLGQRDAQLVAVVRRMIADLAFDSTVVVAPIMRDADKLAIAVCNGELTASQRNEARAIPEALRRAREMASQGVTSPDRIIAEVTHLLAEHRRVRIIYIAIVDPATMEPQREVVPGGSLLALAAWVDEVRLIDNTPL